MGNYNVTGMARNQGNRLLSNVQVEVIFYNAQHEVLDSRVIRIGSMAPGDVRAFRAESTSYDNLYNIVSYDCNPRWD